jgi:hypothetical protein
MRDHVSPNPSEAHRWLYSITIDLPASATVRVYRLEVELYCLVLKHQEEIPRDGPSLTFQLIGKKVEVQRVPVARSPFERKTFPAETADQSGAVDARGLSHYVPVHEC